jgi:hypothetical protein
MWLLCYLARHILAKHCFLYCLECCGLVCSAFALKYICSNFVVIFRMWLLHHLARHMLQSTALSLVCSALVSHTRTIVCINCHHFQHMIGVTASHPLVLWYLNLPHKDLVAYGPTACFYPIAVECDDTKSLCVCTSTSV